MSKPNVLVIAQESSTQDEFKSILTGDFGYVAALNGVDGVADLYGQDCPQVLLGQWFDEVVVTIHSEGFFYRLKVVQGRVDYDWNRGVSCVPLPPP